MNEFESWLKRATWRLSRESARLVRTEIQEHYDSAREAATNAGASADEADRAALAALGDPKTANRQYRQVLLTSAEVRMLREANWEARAVCSRPWVKSLILAAPAGLLFLAAVAFLMDAFGAVRVLFAAGVAMGVLLTGPLFLPIYTPSRGRVTVS